LAKGNSSKKRKAAEPWYLKTSGLRAEQFCWVCGEPLREVVYVTPTGGFRCAYCRRAADQRSEGALYEN
jgi:hypothetical protein